MAANEAAASKTETPHPLSFMKGMTAGERRLYERIPEEIDYVPHPSFSRPAVEDEYFGSGADDIEIPSWTQFAEVPDDVQTSGRKGKSRLSTAEEKALFLRYNYARYRLHLLVESQRNRRTLPRAKDMLVWFRRVLKARADLVRANLPLVLAMAKRTRIPNVEFSEVVSEGNMALLRSVEKFDASRGFKFSTYACRSILKAFNRLATKTGKYRARFPVEFDPDLEKSDYEAHRHSTQRDDSIHAIHDIIARNRARLTPVERTILIERFALGSRERGRTLAEVGRIVGLTNERVRQVQNAALDKVRSVLDEKYLVA